MQIPEKGQQSFPGEEGMGGEGEESKQNPLSKGEKLDWTSQNLGQHDGKDSPYNSVP